MTYIEFFEENALENLCSSLSNLPDRIIFIGSSRKNMQRHIEDYQDFFRSRNQSVEILCETVDRNNPEAMKVLLRKIVEQYPDCVFDATGGDELALISLGVIQEEYSGRNIQIQKFNLHNNSVQDYDEDGHTAARKKPELNVNELIRIFGGRVVPETTYVWDMSEEFEQDIRTMWKICRQNPHSWNLQIGILDAVERCKTENSALLTTEADTNNLLTVLHADSADGLLSGDVLRQLQEAGMLEELTCGEDLTRVTYKDARTKQSLIKAGQILELKIYLAARYARDKKDRAVYHDVLVGVNIDWSDEKEEPGQAPEVRNEIDVIAMHGMVPVFISCKNGGVTVDELHKLDTVAERFGGEYSKKILVISNLDENSKAGASLLSRAEKMKIRVVNNVYAMTDEELEKTVGNLWCS